MDVLRHATHRCQLRLLVVKVRARLSVLSLGEGQLIAPGVPSLQEGRGQRILVIRILNERIRRARIAFGERLQSRTSYATPPFLSFREHCFQFMLTHDGTKRYRRGRRGRAS